MEAVLVTRNPGTDQQGNITTADLRITVNLPTSANDRSSTLTQLYAMLPPTPASSRTATDLKASTTFLSLSSPASSFPGAPGSTSNDATDKPTPVDLTYKPHTLSGWSNFGTNETNEFATWAQGRGAFLGDAELREALEDDLRGFAERSDHTEGFMLSSSVSSGYSGFTGAFLEMLRDEFSKSSVFTTAMLEDSLGWKREDTERSKHQRLINATLSLFQLEELSSMVLPIQPPTTWEDEAPWTKYLRQDVPRPEAYSQILNQHLQSANSELREPDCLNQIISQLNWRGDNKFAHLVGASPLLPPEMLTGVEGQTALKASFKDFSVFETPKDPTKLAPRIPREVKPYAQYTVVRGYDDASVQALGPILEASTPLKEPLATWVCLPDPYPIFPSAPPLYRGLLPNGRPLLLSQPLPTDPYTATSLFGAPNPLFPSPSTYVVQPSSIPLLTTLTTTPSTSHLLRSLAGGVKELIRVRSRSLWEFEEGEWSVGGREGVREAVERLETLADGMKAEGEGEEEEGLDEDEHFEEKDDDDDWDL